MIPLFYERCLFNEWLGMPSGWKRKWMKNFVRVLILVGFMVTALILGDNVKMFLAVAGGVACVPLCFVLPVLVTNGLLKPGVFARWSHNILMVLGVLGGIGSLLVVFLTGGAGGH